MSFVACAGSASDATTTTTEANALTTTTEQDTTTTAASEPTTTSADASTTTASETTGTVFVLTDITFGASGSITMSNVGSEAGSLTGHFLCQRPTYVPLGDVELQPGDTLTLLVGSDINIGGLDPTSGESRPLHVLELL